ncbi:MAG: CPBP family intramembrane metalloprotease [Ignavibacteriae bacterium]|nr:MAG: CPBP family intramembrane metalloprotease [Ignavibacteriota bacterium]
MYTLKNTSKQIITFIAVTIIISTGIFIWMFNGAKNNTIAVLIMMWTPGISAIITSLIYKEKISDFGWKPGKMRFLIYAYILPLVVSLIAYGFTWLSGFAEFTASAVVNYKWAKLLGFELPAPFFIGVFSKMSLGFMLTCVVVLGEEIGWSGFLTPKLLKLYSIPVVSIFIGIFWSVWHYPAIIGGFYGQGTPLWISLPGFTLVLTGLSFVRTVLVQKSKSLWTGVVLHSSSNIILMGMFYEMTVHKGYAAYIVSETGIFTGIVFVIISLIFIKFQKHLTYA